MHIPPLNRVNRKQKNPNIFFYTHPKEIHFSKLYCKLKVMLSIVTKYLYFFIFFPKKKIYQMQSATVSTSPGDSAKIYQKATCINYYMASCACCSVLEILNTLCFSLRNTNAGRNI